MKMSSLITILPLFAATWVIGVIAQATGSPTIEGVLTEAAKQIPALCALIWIVYQFLGHLRTMAETYSSALGKIAEALEKSTEMLGRVSEVCARMEHALDDAREPKGAKR